MTSQVVFLSLFLGLTAGPHLVELQVGPGVHTVRMLLEKRPVAVLQQPPWRATVDFGSSIVPGELVAVGYDAHGNEVARATQFVNVARPVAEFNITLQNDAAGVPATAQFKWEHLVAAKVVSASLTVDEKSVSIDNHAIARLPRLDMKRPHLITGEMKFEDGFVTRRELVIGGELTDTAEAELTPVAVRQTGAAPANLGACFTSGGAPLRVGAIEKLPALVIFVLDPSPEDPLRKLNPQLGQGLLQKMEVRHLVALDIATTMRALFPLAERRLTTSNSTAELFPPSNDVASEEGGLIWFLTRPYEKSLDANAPRQFTDAVGVAGLNAITGAHRRAVVLMLSSHADASAHSAASVRNYLASIGVPLFVWSPAGPRPELRATWGDIDDISSRPKLNEAADRLRAELASQRVAWVAADPVTALRIHATGKCGITPLAH
ncbi:MAG TPA: hypothetical protein VGQ46_11840 [Thermoanaerobaculia bacterium]|nr:hypothetical protein [Thermoanaerobaculia bacterium]